MGDKNMEKFTNAATCSPGEQAQPPVGSFLQCAMFDLAPSQPLRVQYHHGDLAQALKRVALQLITERGIEGISMRQVASALGVAPSAMYRHFADKSELLNALAYDGFGAMGELWLRRLAHIEPHIGANPALRSVARFSAGADAYFQFGLDHPALFQLMFGPFGTGSATWVMGATGMSANPYVLLGQALDGLCEAKVISSSARFNAEVGAFSAIHGLTCLAVSGVYKNLPPGQQWEQLELVKNSILGGLLAWEQVQQFKAPLGAALAPGMLGRPLPNMDA